MKRSVRLLWLLWMCVGMVGAPLSVGRAQEGGLVVTIDEINVDAYQGQRQLTAYVTVRHPQVGAVRDLEAADFTLSLSDEKFTPDTATLEDARVSMAIVLELYRSMEGQPLSDAKTAVSNLCLNKGASDRVAIFGVRRGVNPDSLELDAAYEYGFTEDGGAVSNFVQELAVVKEGTGTPLYDAIIKAMRHSVEVSQEPVGRRGVVVITDGGDVDSHNNQSVVIDTARNLRVPIYTVGYTGKTRRFDQFLNELANRTGGDYKNTPDSAGIDAFLSEIRGELSKRYMLVFAVDDLSSSRQILQVRVDKSGMSGQDSLAFDVPLGESGGGEATTEPTAETPSTEETPETPDETATPEVEPESQEAGWLAWIKQNLVLVIGVGVLLLAVIVVGIVLVVRRRQAATQAPAVASVGGATLPAYAPPVRSDGYNAPPTVGSATSVVDGETELGNYTPYTASDPFGYDSQRNAPPLWQNPAGIPGAGMPAVETQPAPGMAASQPAPPVGAAPEGRTLILGAGPRLMQAQLLDRATGQVYPVSAPQTTIGRQQGNTLQIQSDKVSRQHARIVAQGAGFVVMEDTPSGNGTFVNGVRVSAPTPLKDGDEVRFADRTFTFKCES